jgi:hypothetical protein
LICCRISRPKAVSFRQERPRLSARLCLLSVISQSDWGFCQPSYRE